MKEVFAICLPRSLLILPSKFGPIKFRGLREVSNNFVIRAALKFTTLPVKKNSLAEHCIRNLKTILCTIFEENGSYKCINFIENLVELLNARINRKALVWLQLDSESETQKMSCRCLMMRQLPLGGLHKSQTEKSKIRCR